MKVYRPSPSKSATLLNLATIKKVIKMVLKGGKNIQNKNKI
jgi:hypothetical protein